MDIKIKLDSATIPKEFNRNLQKWEGEGGSPVNARRDLDQIEAPLKDGQKFEVLGGEVVEEGDDLFYKAAIKTIT